MPVYGAASDQPGEAGPDVPVAATGGRTPWLPIAAAVVVLLLVIGAVTAGRAMTDDADGRATDLAFSRTIDLPAPVERTPSLAWKRSVEASAVLGVDGSVLVADDRAAIVALDADDGDERWSLAPPGGDRSVAWLSRLGDTVVVAYGEGDPADAIDGDDLQLASVDAGTGRVRWRYEEDGVVFAVPIDEDLITVYRRASVRVPLDITFLAAATGRERWTASGELRAIGRTTAYVTTDGDLVAHGLVTGEERWRRSLPEHRGGPSGAEVGGTLVVGRDGSTIVGLSVRDGRFDWSRSVPGGVRAVVSTGEQAVAVGEQASGVDPATGEIVWSSDAEAWRADLLLTVDGRSGVYSLADQVVRLDPEAGGSIARAEAQARVESLQSYLQPSLADGVLYLTGDAHELVGVDVDTLEPRWTLDTGLSLDLLAAADDTVLVATSRDLVAYR